MSSSPISPLSLPSLVLFEQMQRRGDLAAPTIPIDLDAIDTQLQESAEAIRLDQQEDRVSRAEITRQMRVDFHLPGLQEQVRLLQAAADAQATDSASLKTEIAEKRAFLETKKAQKQAAQASAESTSALCKQGVPLPYAQLIQQAGKGVAWYGAEQGRKQK